MLNVELEFIFEAAANSFRELGCFPNLVSYITPLETITSPVSEVYQLCNSEFPLPVVARAIRKRSNARFVVTLFNLESVDIVTGKEMVVNGLYFQSPIEDRLFLCHFGEVGLDVVEVEPDSIEVPDMYGRKVLEN